MADSSVEDVLSVDEVLLVVDVLLVDDELDVPDGGGGGGPGGWPAAPTLLAEVLLDDESVDEVESVDREASRLWSCASSAVVVSVDEVPSVDDVLPVDEVVDELDVPDGGGGGGGPGGRSVPATLLVELVLDEESVDEVDESALGGGPGGGPPAPAVLLEPSLLELESSLSSEPPPVCSCDRIDRRPDIAELMPLESTVDMLDVASADVEVDVDADDDVSSVAAVWLDAELLWLCIMWWWECALSETDKGISVGRWFDDASRSAIGSASAPRTATGRCSTWDTFPLTDHS